MENDNALFDAEAAIEAVLPKVDSFQRRSDVDADPPDRERVVVRGKRGQLFSRPLRQMICMPAALYYLNDISPVVFRGHDLVPVVFPAIDAWVTIYRAHARGTLSTRTLATSAQNQICGLR